MTGRKQEQPGKKGLSSPNRSSHPKRAAAKDEPVERKGWRPDALLSAFLCIVVLGLIVYGNTTQIPWYLDDTANIVDNPVVRDLGGAVRNIFSDGRGLAILTFALNYQFGGLDVTGFHLVNIFLHLATTFLVFLLLKRIFVQRLPALAGALVFLLHPLQTQSVNYVVQRMTVMAACFFLLSLYLYVRWRESAGADQNGKGRVGLLVGSVVAGGLAFLSKQNTVVLPLVLILVDRLLLAERMRLPSLPWKRLLLIGLPFFCIAAVIGYRDMLGPLLHGAKLIETTGTADLTGSGPATPLRYLFTEFSVLWLYLRLMILPYGQMLAYGYPLVDSLLEPKSLLAMGGLLVLAASAWKAREHRPLWSFAVAWFFLTLAVESSFIPLDPVFEHRLYLPMLALAVLVGWGIESLRRWRLEVPAVALIVVVLGLLSWQRNQLWRDPVAFWRDNVSKSAADYRAVLGLADALMKQGKDQEATEVYRRYLPVVLKNRALRNNSNIMLNVGVAFVRIGDFHLAEEYLRYALAARPDYLLAHFNLGVVLYQRGDKQGALREFELAARINPRDVDNLFNLAVLSLETGDRSRAEVLLPQLERLDPGLGGKLKERLAAAR